MTTATIHPPRNHNPLVGQPENSRSAAQDQVASLRADQLLAKTIEYFPSLPTPGQSGVVKYILPPNDHRDNSRILSGEEELNMFRAMNNTKRRADQLRKSLSPVEPSTELMDEIEHLLKLADRIRNRVVQIFMKLGASIARRLASAEFPVDDLVSEANMTLMRAVDRFDCERGFRFSTYATNAVRRNLIRFIKTRRRHKEKVVALENLDEFSENRKWTFSYEQQVTRATATLDEMMRRLEQRDQFILRSRFGLTESGRGQSLQCIADVLGVSRERVRQLENRATERLRQMAKVEHFAPLDA